MRGRQDHGRHQAPAKTGRSNPFSPLKSPSEPVLITAAALLVIGLAFLIIPSSTDVSGHRISCGSALAPSDDASIRDAATRIADAMLGRTSTPHAEQDCAAALSQRRIIGWPLAALGTAALIGVGAAQLMMTTGRRPENSE